MPLFLGTEHVEAYLFSYPVQGTPVPVAVDESHFALGRVFFPEPAVLPPTEARERHSFPVVIFPLASRSMTSMHWISCCDNATRSCSTPDDCPQTYPSNPIIEQRLMA